MATEQDIPLEELQRIRLWRAALISELSADVRLIAHHVYGDRDAMLAMIRVLRARGGNLIECMGLRLYFEELRRNAALSTLDNTPPEGEEEAP